ncbi:MAG TPA: LysM peptidoglycan-binding domain-containing protein [Myxococcales bacterium]|nr:LysM peptidoglycan-binding domain-containing protein [Myxococcales bacterium]
MALVKAKILNLDKKDDDLTVLFNPKEFSIQKTVQWEPHKAPGLNVPEHEFTSGNPRILNVELFFDTYEEKKSVHEYTDKLHNYALIDVEKHQPPVVMFQWGKISFTGVIETLNLRFTMFLSDGTACRAVASLSIKEWKTAKDQAATEEKHSPDHSKRRTVKTGETLALIAHEEYDDAGEWRRIADANGITDPKDVKPGTVLTLPPIL